MIKIKTKNLFRQFDSKLSREECWNMALQLGWKFNILEGVWIK